MGLDMWLYRIDRLTKKDIREIDDMSYDELCDSAEYAVLYYDVDDSDKPVGRLRDIVDFGHIISRSVSELDIDEICRKFNLPEGSQIGGSIHMGGESVYYFYAPGDDTLRRRNGKRITSADMERVGGCWKPVPREFLIIKYREIAYWRKEYDLQEELYGFADTRIENCGYYKVNSDMAKAIMKYERKWDKEGWSTNGLTRDMLKSTKNRLVVYHEWY